MAFIPTVPDDETSDELRALYDPVRNVDGSVDNILRVHSLHSGGLRGHIELYRAVMRRTKTLSKIDREMIAVVVSVLNNCHY